MARICVLALNSVVRDIRIIKEADTLAHAGHDVTIIGLLDNNAPGPVTHRDSGVRIFRRDYKKTVSTVRTMSHGVKRAAKPAALATAAVYAFYNIFLIPNLAISWLREWPLPGAISVGFCVFVTVYFWHLRHKLLQLARKLLLAPLRALGWNKLRTIGSAEAPPLALKFNWVSFRTFFYGVVSRTSIRSELIQGAVATRPDVIHCQDLGTLPAGVRAKRRTGARLVFDAHEIYEEVAQGNQRRKRYYQKMLKRHQGEVDHFITINDSIAEFYAKNYSKLPQAVIIKNATLRAEPFTYDGRMHRAAGLPRKQKILLYQGGFATKRGLTVLVQAARWLEPDWTLVMMGWGSLEEALLKVSSEVLEATRPRRKVPAVVFLPPAPMDELAHWSAGGTIGVIPYENVGLNHLFCTPNKLWEYPNAGVPLLCSPLVEMTKTIEQYKIGWLLPAELTPQNLAGMVNTLDDKEIKRARRACRTYLKQDNWSVYAERLIELYVRMPGLESDLSRDQFGKTPGHAAATMQLKNESY